MVSLLSDVLYPQVRGRSFAPVFTAKDKKSAEPQTQTQQKNSNVVSKLLLPACAVGAGGVLLYLGFRKPGMASKIQDLYKDRIDKMTLEIKNFRAQATTGFDKEYKKITPYITDYRKSHAFEYLAYTARIQDSAKGAEVLGAVNDAFLELKGIRAQDLKAGVFGMDEFRSFMYNINHPVYQSLSNVRSGASMKMLDYSLMPRFKNGAHKESLVKFEEKLGQIRAAADKKMFDIQNKLTDEHIHQSSQRMAKQMLLVRKDLNSSAEMVMDTAFTRVSKIYNLGDDFKPLFRKGKSMEAFELLSKKNLKPQNLSAETREMLNNDYVSRVLETVDFQKIDDKMMKSLFDWMPSDFDTKQMDMITDRIRLQQAISKAEDAAENPELTTVAAKLEYLSDRLEKYGKEKLIERCSQDFSNLNRSQIHSRVYYINSAGRKIGLTGIEDIDRFMIEQKPEYLDSSFKSHVKEILEQPEYYFM